MKRDKTETGVKKKRNLIIKKRLRRRRCQYGY